MFFLKRFRCYVNDIGDPNNVDISYINNVKFGISIQCECRDQITMHDLHNKEQILECTLIRANGVGLPSRPLRLKDEISTYIETKDGSHHGRYVEFNYQHQVKKYISYKNGILHGKSIIPVYEKFVCNEYFSIKYTNGYANQIRILEHSNYRGKCIRIRYYDIPLTYISIGWFNIEKISEKAPNHIYYYNIYEDNRISYRNDTANKVVIYTWNDKKELIHKTERKGNIAVTYYSGKNQRLSITVYSKIEQFSMKIENCLIEYQWETVNGKLVCTIDLFKTPNCEEYTTIKYIDGVYRKQCTKRKWQHI